MFKILKNSTFFDRTLYTLILSVLLIVIVIVSTYPKTKPANEKVVALKNAELFYKQDVIEKINKGDSVTILGQKKSSYGINFWIETKSGQRGFAPQDAFDDQAIVYKEKKVDNGLTVKNGEIVTVIGLSDKEGGHIRYDIKTQDGKTGTVKADGIISKKGFELAKYKLNDRRAIYMSKNKFERLYIGKTFEDSENKFGNALIISNKNGQKAALYDLRVFDKKDGKFYNPTIEFEDNVAKSYSLEKARNMRNSWFLKNDIFLKYLPLSDKILDVDFFAFLIKGNTFERLISADYTNSAFNKVTSIIKAIFLGLAALLWFFITNLTIPLLLFGILKFRYPLIFLGNRLVPMTLLIIGIATSYIWIVLGLSYRLLWWFFLPIIIYVFLYFFRKLREFFDEFPDNRCPDCKRLYSINFFTKTLQSEEKEWRPKEDRAELLDSYTERWQTGDKVTTYDQYSDGSRRNFQTKIENIQNHSRTIKTYKYNVFNVLYMVRKYQHTYKCNGCGYEQYKHTEELEELDRKFVKSYAR